MISVRCEDVTMHERLALAGAISDGLAGKAIALDKGGEVVVDDLTSEKVEASAVADLVREFVSRRKNSDLYVVEQSGETITVRGPDPVAAASDSGEPELPPNLMKCPFCSFVTPYEEAYVVHYRSHGFT